MTAGRAKYQSVLFVVVVWFAAHSAYAQEAVLSNGGATDEERLIALTLTEACGGARGEIDWTDVVRADVNEDGLEDIVIDHIKIRCFGETGRQSMLCGVGGNCSVTIHTRENFGWRIR
jgi:hypothetical protein